VQKFRQAETIFRIFLVTQRRVSWQPTGDVPLTALQKSLVARHPPPYRLSH